MALRGLAYSVRMAAYNADGVRVTGLAATITATLWADGTAATLSGITITEIGTTGVYIVPLTAEQMTAYNLCITAVSSTAGITIDPVYMDTEAGRIDVATSTRLATSGYTTPPTVSDIQSGLAKTSEIPTPPTVEQIQTGLATATALQNVTDIVNGISDDVLTIHTEMADIDSLNAKTAMLSGMIEAVDNVVDAIALRMPSSGTVATIDDLPIPPTVADIQSGLAKTSELPSVPTVSELVAGVWTANERTITGGSLTIEPPTAETIAESVWTRSSRLITGGAPTAISIASAVWSADTRTITATPVYNGPTAAEMAAACVESIASTFIVPAIYGIKIERTSAYPDRRQQQEAFAARIQRMYDDSPLNPAFVESISYTAYKLESNVAGVPSTIVTGHENVPVATSCLSATLQQSAYWTLDQQGCNFVHVPDQTQNYLFPTAGVYEVVYTITLVTGSPITLVYNAVITE